MRFALKDPMLVTIRVEGKYGAVRELSAVVDFNSPYCTVLSQDAIDLGYPEGGNKHNERERTHPEETPRFSSMRGIDRGIQVKLHKVSIGSLSAKDVVAVVLELEHPRHITFDFVLGRSFLKHFKLAVDVKAGYLSLT
jgi:hypothetical protein